MTDPDGELSQSERDAIAGLRREAPPPRSLEDATVAALERRGLLVAPSNPARRLAWIGAGIAASLVMFGAGLVLGRRPPAGSPESGSRYVMLLYEGPTYVPPPQGHEMDRVREYARWARTARQQGKVLGGEELTDEAGIVVGQDAGVSTSGPSTTRLAGFFVIGATDRRAALELARTCPHVHYGGTVVLREIEPT